jgi:hypothetical protein
MSFQRTAVIAGTRILSAVAIIQINATADDQAAPSGTNSVVAPHARFGLFDGLDHRSAYNQEFFPQPLLVDDTGLEQDGELEFNFLHTQASAQHSDMVMAGVQKSFGMLTLELGVPYERNSDSDDTSQGVSNIDLSARYPLFQFVSATGFFDTTLGVGMETGIPVNSAVSKNTEWNPVVFNDVKLGEHFSIQTVLGYDALLGGGENGGLQTFEYGFAFGYAVPHGELPLPGVKQFTPLFELDGETELNNGESGQSSLLGSIGFRADLKPIGDVQPSFGLGFVFPIDSGAREEVHWGIATSLTVDF